MIAKKAKRTTKKVASKTTEKIKPPKTALWIWLDDRGKQPLTVAELRRIGKRYGKLPLYVCSKLEQSSGTDVASTQTLEQFIERIADSKNTAEVTIHRDQQAFPVLAVGIYYERLLMMGNRETAWIVHRNYSG